MSKLICNTADDIKSVPPDAFSLLEGLGGPGGLEPCAQLPDLDLRPWAVSGRNLLFENLRRIFH